MADSIALLNALRPTLNRLHNTQTRQLLLLQGERAWQETLTTALCGEHNTLVLADKCPPLPKWQSAEAYRLKHWLGQSFDFALIDIHDGLTADQLGIVAGVIRGGGLLILWLPPNWPETVNPHNQRFLNTPITPEHTEPWFYRHLAQCWQSDALWLRQGQALPADLQNPTPIRRLVLPTPPSFPFGAATLEQHKAITAILKVAFGHRKRPLVIHADRGRGKSAALGLAAVQALIQGKEKIAISAATPEQTQSAFTHAADWLKNTTAPELTDLHCHSQQLCFEWLGQRKSLDFYAPDHLILMPVSCDLLLVDEAAQLPMPLLQKLLKKYSRLVFASTLHGYEGSGRGFGLRFAKILHQQAPGWQALHLQQPLRWRNNDKLEHLMNQALLLAPETADANAEPRAKIRICRLDKSALLAELPNLFGLLVQAHYQTRPNDLQQLLDSPNPIWVAYAQQTAVGILLSQEEGNLTAADQDTGQIHGHLLPQLLSRQYGFRAALNWRSWRLMRLAIAPEWQGMGIGTQLVRAWQDAAKIQQIDFLSCSFAAEHRLLAFWRQQGLQPLHLGTHRDKASGSYTLVMIQTLNSKTDRLEQIQQQFYQQLPTLLSDELSDLEDDLLHALWQAAPALKPLTTAQQQEIALAYATQQRSFNSSSGFIRALIAQHPAQLARLEATAAHLLSDKCFKGLNWTQLARAHQLSGKSAAEKAFRTALQKFLTQLEAN